MKELLLPEATGQALFAVVGRFWLIPVVYLLIVNLIALFLMWRDKRLAKKENARRIPEKTLFLSALLGGSVGAIAGMQLFRHKTKHWYFVVGMPVILLAQIALAVSLFVLLQK